MRVAKPEPTLQNVIVRFDPKGELNDMVSLSSTAWLTGKNASLSTRKDPFIGGPRWEHTPMSRAAIDGQIVPAAEAVRELLLKARPSDLAGWGMTLDPLTLRDDLFEARPDLADGTYSLVIEEDVSTPVSVRGAIETAPIELRNLLDALVAARA